MPQTPNIRLRSVAPGDVPIFFQHQCDAIAARHAAFTGQSPGNKEAFLARWQRQADDPTILRRTIEYLDPSGAIHVAGYVGHFRRDGVPEVAYWIDRALWGKGIATAALRDFLPQIAVRPLFARSALDNLASIRVLEKSGFKPLRHEVNFAKSRGCEIEEVVMVLA